jgi:hypothetical protein
MHKTIEEVASTDLPDLTLQVTSGRKPVSKKLRFEVFKRDGFACQYCGAHPPDVLLEIDHIISVKDGGGNDEGNLFASCFDCNRGKGARPLSSAPKSLAEKGEEIREREVQLLGYREIMQLRADRIEADMWRVADALVKDASTNGMNRDWLRGIKTFNDRLPLHDVLEAVETAYAKKPFSNARRFKYFCGICWKKIRETDGESSH